MAATGFTPIQLYRTSTPSATPTAGNLADGELAINTADGKLFYKDSGGVVQTIANKNNTGTVTSVAMTVPSFLSISGTPITTSGTLALSLSGTALPAVNGGTGQTSYAVGDLLFASTTTALSRLADVATGNALISGGVGVAPSYGKIGLTTHVSGTLPIANGGTNATATPTAGAVAYGTGTAYAFNTAGTSGQPLLSGGSGAPTFGTLSVGAGGTGQTTYLDGQLLIGNTVGNTLTKSTLTAGSGISITNGNGSITIAATGSGSVASVGQTFTGGLISVTGSPITTSGTLALTVAGTSGGIPYFSSASTWASSGALAANSLVVGGGAGAAPSTVTTGTGVVTALGVNTGSAGAFVVNGGALGTPSSGTVTNLTGTASININGTVGATTPNTGNFTSVTSTSETVTGAAGILTRAAATQDGVALLGRAGGTGSFRVALTPTTLTASRTVTLPNADINFVSGLGVAQGGTGTTSLTANNVILGNGTSAVQFVAPGTSGNVLTSSGGTWVSAAPAASLIGITDNATTFTTALGESAGTSISGANTFNVCIGRQAGLSLTTGSLNTAVGSGALASLSTGLRSTAVGYSANSGGTGDDNTTLGYNTGNALTTGTQNTIVGSNAGFNLPNAVTTGSNNTIIGYNAGTSSATVSNTVTLGNSSIATLRCAVTTITAISDARDKTNVLDLSAGLTFIKALRPVSFDWAMRDGGKVGDPDTGFIAQDLKAAQESTGVSIPGLVNEDNPDKLEAGYSKLLPAMVKAIQELSAEVEFLKSKLAALS